MCYVLLCPINILILKILISPFKYTPIKTLFRNPNKATEFIY